MGSKVGKKHGERSEATLESRVEKSLPQILYQPLGKNLRRIRNKTRLVHLVDLGSRDQSLVNTLGITRILIVSGSCGGSSKKVFFRVGMGVWATPSHHETQP